MTRMKWSRALQVSGLLRACRSATSSNAYKWGRRRENVYGVKWKKRERENMAAMDPAQYPADSGPSDVISCDIISCDVTPTDSSPRNALPLSADSPRPPRDYRFDFLWHHFPWHFPRRYFSWRHFLWHHSSSVTSFLADPLSRNALPLPADYRFVYPWVRIGPLYLLICKYFKSKLYHQ